MTYIIYPQLILKAWNTRAGIDIGNTIGYDMKPYQFKTTIIIYTKVLIKVLNLTVNRKRCWYGQRVCDKINQT